MIPKNEGIYLRLRRGRKRIMMVLMGRILFNVRCQDLSLYEGSSIRGTWLDLSLSFV